MTAAARAAAPLVDPRPDPLTALTTAERYAQLAAAIAVLPPFERAVLALGYIEELAPAQIALVLEVSLDEVTALHAGALAQLRAALAASGDAGAVS